MNTINFQEKELVVIKSEYTANNINAIILIRNDENICNENIPYLREYTLSVCAENRKHFDKNYNLKKSKELKEDYFYIKNYSENEEIAKFLLNNGYLEETKDILICDFSTHSVCFPKVKMTEKFKQCIFKL